MWSVILFTFVIDLTLKLSFGYVIKCWTQLFIINLISLFQRYQVQCNMASAVMICFLWKSLQEKREYDCFPVNHIACEQALRLQRATRGERERASDARWERTRERAAKSRGAEEKETSFPVPHTRLSYHVGLSRDFSRLPQMESLLASY